MNNTSRTCSKNPRIRIADRVAVPDVKLFNKRLISGQCRVDHSSIKNERPLSCSELSFARKFSRKPDTRENFVPPSIAKSSEHQSGMCEAKARYLEYAYLSDCTDGIDRGFQRVGN